MHKFPASIPRRQFWSHSVGKTHCPQCDTELEQERHTYLMVATERDGLVEFITATDGGHFCPACPTVVLDFDKFDDLARNVVRPIEPEIGFAVLGTVDRDAVPEEKRNLRFDAEHNPSRSFGLSTLCR